MFQRLIQCLITVVSTFLSEVNWQAILQKDKHARVRAPHHRGMG